VASDPDKLARALGGDRPLWSAVDRWIVALFVIAGALAVVGVTSLYAEEVYSLVLDDIYFQADLFRNLDNITDRTSLVWRSHVHPIWVLLVYPVEMLLVRGLGISEMRAIFLINAASAGAWLGLIFGLLRAFGLRRPDAIVFTLLAGVSAAAIFWFPVPETYCLGTLSLLLPLLLAAGRASTRWLFLLADAFSLGITVTNWMAGIAATISRFPLHKAVSLLLSSLVLVGALFAVQKVFFPISNVPVFLKPFNGIKEVKTFSGHPLAEGPRAAVRAILFHGMVAPAIHQRPSKMLTFQMSALGSSGTLGLVATILWATLMSAGVVSLFTCRMAMPARFAFGAVLFGQLALHSVYGDEHFLYGLHVTPLLVILAALTTLTRARIVALVLAIALIPCALTNNARQWLTAVGPGISRLYNTPHRVPLIPLKDFPPRPLPAHLHFMDKDEWRRNQKWLLILPLIAAVELVAIAAWYWPRLVRQRTNKSGENEWSKRSYLSGS
jgi:hypothetical protein